MNFLSANDNTDILQAFDDLWDTSDTFLTIVKEPQIAVTNLNGSYIPGFGQTSNPNNFVPTPESRTFPCLTKEKAPDNSVDYVTNKQEPKQVISLKVKQDARDYIQDGRRTLYALYQGRKFNILSDEEVAKIGTRVYYIFKLEVIR